MNIKENDKKEIILSTDQTAFHEKENDQLRLLKKELPSVNNQKIKNIAEFIVVTTPPAKKSNKHTTEIHDLKEQLKAKEQLLNNHINAINSTNASLEFDLEGNILSANKNFLEIMGYNETDLLGKHHSLLVDSSYSKSNAYQLFWNSLKKEFIKKMNLYELLKMVN